MKLQLSLTVHEDNARLFEEHLNKCSDSTNSQIMNFSSKKDRSGTHFNIVFQDVLAIWQVAYGWSLIINKK